MTWTFRTVRNIPVTILRRPSRSALTVPMMFPFESMDQNGKALCLGETVILPEEINPFISVLRHYDILVTALHNHWLFNNPGIMFIHFESIDEPVQFAHKVRHALSVLKH
ncbi:DUF1259 domain-containing protein [Brevibacillus sp. AF8]|uniref:DUF1259 domain-containing protein n=1 Tax=Brevibacillus sp. AF8 TaxID=2825881 RepID=UPI001F8E6FFD|nr:DUF1259 domain-containing protein [Brevibacillus sp. AF8]